MSRNNTAYTPGPWHAENGVSQMVSDDTTIASVGPRSADSARWWIFSPADIHGDTEADARLIAAAPELLEFAQIIGAAYPDDPGTSDLDNEQPVTIMLGDVRRAWRLIAKATGGAK